MNVFVVLGLAWVAFLAKFASGFVSRRSGPSLSGLFGASNTQRSNLPQLAPYRISSQRSSRSSIRRRRDVLVALLGLCLATLLPVLVIGGSLFVTVNLLVDVALFSYIVALIQRKKRR